MTNFLDGLSIGEPITSGSLFMFPLLAEDPSSIPPLSFDEALERNAVHLDETSLAGSVPELVIENRGDRSVFLLDGEQIIGLKQNRTFNLSMLISPRSRAVVPVSCLEAGRWSRGSAKFHSAEHVHFARGRANKLRAVSESIRRDGSYASNQAEVWRDISRKFAAAREQSATGAEAEFYSRRKEQLDSLRCAIPVHDKQVGAVVGLNDRVVGLDVFSAPHLYERLHNKLLRSYLLDAIEHEQSPLPPPREVVLRMMRGLFASDPERAASPGAGQTLRWTTKEGSAAALFCDGECIHAVAFCAGTESGEGHLQGEVA